MSNTLWIAVIGLSLLALAALLAFYIEKLQPLAVVLVGIGAVCFFATIFTSEANRVETERWFNNGCTAQNGTVISNNEGARICIKDPQWLEVK